MTMKKISGIILIAAIVFASGCTSRSTELAQINSIRTQAVKDGVVETLSNALARENYETAILGLEIAAIKAGDGMSAADKAKLESVVAQGKTILKEFAMKRDIMSGLVVDNERANTLKAVTVDAKLWSEQGILNYFGERLSSGGKKFWNAWDSAKQIYTVPPK